jgi:hypothetical protein
MTIRARFFTAVLAALPLWACSSTSPSSGAAEPGGGVSPGALAGEVNSPMNGTAPGAESGVDAQTPAGGESAPSETTGRPGGIGRFGGQTGGEAGIRCSADVELEPLAFDTVSPLGYSAAEIVSALAPSYAASFTYADDSATPLTVGLASAGQAAYAPGCSRIAIDVVVAWSTADGAFDETLRGKLFALSPEAATLSVEVPAGDLAGSYPSRHAAELGPPPLSFSFELEFAPSAAHGSVSALRGPPDNQDSLGIGSF